MPDPRYNSFVNSRLSMGVVGGAIAVLVVMGFLVGAHFRGSSHPVVHKPPSSDDAESLSPPLTIVTPPEPVTHIVEPSSPTAVSAPPIPSEVMERNPEDVSLTLRLHSVANSNPSEALDLAEEGMRRFPASPDAPERAAIMVISLGRLGRYAESRREARKVVERYPNTPWAEKVRDIAAAAEGSQ